jgi:hypothetical protein
MSIRWIAVAAAGMLMAFAVPATAQRAVLQQDSPEAQLRGVLRAFYFNLAHHDWEAIAADVLSAKVMASRPAPASIQTAIRDRAPAKRSSGSADEPAACSSNTSALVGEAAIQLDGNWAGVSIPRCGVAATGADEFRLIHIERRWRFVYIDLFEERMIVPD